MKEPIGKQDLRAGGKSEKKRKWYSLIDKVWAYSNLEMAFYDVKKNRGAHGVDRQCHD
ncbi:RNA-directed DNA polymerase [Bacillus sp. OxB-1]|uniref:hypothetical protein n=1 Tax=Bacillus sp. (strain OxB-1) TaxID=98228 RepID=UPI0005822F0A|nr:hypothetical protein [Bacillus sp. OxB-1]BAQ10182.1 RNA-directed DNA polymerase [Bacillus sp. OxB-1]